MGKCLFLRKGETHTAPISGILLSSLAEGSIVKLNENGSPVEFYVAKHDYESGLNGTGRTLLVRKDCYGSGRWGSFTVAYSGCTMDTWFNSTYKTLFATEIQNLIGETKFYCTYATKDGDNSVVTISRAVFALSLREIYGSHSHSNAEGTTLSIAGAIRANGFDYHTRSPYVPYSGSYMNWRIASSGGIGSGAVNSDYSYRPCFTLPSNALFDKNTLILKGVA